MAKTQVMERVLADVEKYGENRKLVRTGLITRLTTHFMDPEKLHPNPHDEFCFESIGPNDSIISDYCKEIMRLHRYEIKVFPEPILVARMEQGGYMILNGHHRWAAAIRVSEPRIRVAIVKPSELSALEG